MSIHINKFIISLLKKAKNIPITEKLREIKDRRNLAKIKCKKQDNIKQQKNLEKA